MSRYVMVTVRPYRIFRYPRRARKIVFTMARANYAGAVETLMAHMGYGASDYRIVSAVAVKTHKSTTTP